MNQSLYFSVAPGISRKGDLVFNSSIKLTTLLLEQETKETAYLGLEMRGN